MREFNPTFTNPNPVTCVPGHSTIGVATINDPSGNPVTLLLDGVEVAVTPTQRGTVCWTGWASLDGYDWGVTHTWEVRQGANSDSGTFQGSPGVRDQYGFANGSCDNASGNSDRADLAAAAWPNIRESVLASPYRVAGLFFVDDLGYVDSKSVDDTSGSGLVSTGNPQLTLELDDYLIAWCCFLGMLGFDGDWETADFTDINDRRIIYPREFNRSWCRKNLNWWPQWGDHEFANDMGWDGGVITGGTDFGTSQAGNNPRWTTYPTVEGPGAVAWKAFFGGLQPPYIGANDTVANHWVAKIGCATFATLDHITHNDTIAAYVPADAELMATQITTMHGTNQIEDVLGDVAANKSAFNFFGMANGIRYALDDIQTVNWASASAEYSSGGTQHPIYNHCIAEYRRLFTLEGQNPPSLMDGRYTNGANGCMIFLGGDYHRGNVSRFKKSAYANNREEIFVNVCTGTVGGSSNFDHPLGPENYPETDEAGNVQMLAITDTYANIEGRPNWWHTFVLIDGAASPPKATATLYDLDGAEVWKGTWHQYGGNLPSERVPAFAGAPDVEVE